MVMVVAIVESSSTAVAMTVMMSFCSCYCSSVRYSPAVA